MRTISTAVKETGDTGAYNLMVHAKAKVFYEWGRLGLRRVEMFIGGEDLDKKPELPQVGGIVKRLKAATDKAHTRRRNIIDSWRVNTPWKK